MPSPARRMAKLILQGPRDDQVVTWTADFIGLTITRKQVGGYRREPDSELPISPAAADVFWQRLESIAAKGLRNGACYMLGEVEIWKFEAQDGRRKYAATGIVWDQYYVGHAPAADSFDELSALFTLLQQG